MVLWYMGITSGCRPEKVGSSPTRTANNYNKRVIMKTFFTADTHFDHKNIITYCDRDFNTIEDMNDTIVDRWNSVISNKDAVYHIGDFTLGSMVHFRKWVNLLNGNIKIIPGSHDYRWMKDFIPTDRVQVLPPLVSIEFGNIKVNAYPTVFVLCHYSMQVWDRSHYGSYHLFGHSHGNLKGIGRSMDVGVDTNNFYPYSLDDILKRLGNLPLDK